MLSHCYHMEGAYLYCGQALMITACFTDQLARLADICGTNMYTKEFQASFKLHVQDPAI